ncbi:MAG: aspartate/glutamate racemase family protein [Lysobacterales bacterium]
MKPEKAAEDYRAYRTRRTGYLVLLVFVFLSAPFAAHAEADPGWLPALLEKENITIVVADSGLGGLSVVADAAEKFSRNPVFKQVNLVFFNALFSDQGGYNSLQSREEKLEVFSNALQSMQDRYNPDIILVACNTLSVLIPDTGFVRSASVPVVGIVGDGVEQIAEQLRGKPGARNIIFATQTTVDEGAHKSGLLALGFSDDQVMTQSCPQLTLYIEQGFDSMDTELLIDAYVDEALSSMPEADGPLSVSFNCTHFGYAMDFWKRAFETRGVEVAAYLNPNTRLVDFLLPADRLQRFPASAVTVKVVSMTAIPAQIQDSIGRWLHAVSPVTETALHNFELVPDLIKWHGPVSGAVQ